mgnify:CR=1 FL=1
MMDKKLKRISKAFWMILVITLMLVLIGDLIIKNKNETLSIFVVNLGIILIPSFFYYLSYIILKYKEAIQRKSFEQALVMISIPTYFIVKNILVLFIPIIIYLYCTHKVNFKTKEGNKVFVTRVGWICLIIAIVLTLVFIWTIIKNQISM